MSDDWFWRPVTQLTVKPDTLVFTGTISTGRQRAEAKLAVARAIAGDPSTETVDMPERTLADDELDAVVRLVRLLTESERGLATWHMMVGAAVADIPEWLRKRMGL